MARPHARLRGALIAAGIDEKELARKLLRGTAYISLRMMGKKPWQMDEAYAIMDMLRIPHDQMPDFFPMGGV